MAVLIAVRTGTAPEVWRNASAADFLTALEILESEGAQ